MDNPALIRLGSGTCRLLGLVGLDPNFCASFDGRGTIGLVTLIAVLFLAIVIAWRRFL